MSDTQTAWAMIWAHAAKTDGPFEISDIVPAVAAKLGNDQDEARRLIVFLIDEAARLPDGREFFALEGQAIVPLPEFLSARDAGETAMDAYPFEL
ncbi:MAG: hypothetical protein JWN86_606 [Planctomycetota bacterium]|nr:hypothetical protein [Planctomycetota bacterium]